eukprot:jgi/Bigna1/82523/fgenesh1_pg.93_\
MASSSSMPPASSGSKKRPFEASFSKEPSFESNELCLSSKKQRHVGEKPGFSLRRVSVVPKTLPYKSVFILEPGRVYRVGRKAEVNEIWIASTRTPPCISRRHATLRHDGRCCRLWQGSMGSEFLYKFEESPPAPVPIVDLTGGWEPAAADKKKGENAPIGDNNNNNNNKNNNSSEVSIPRSVELVGRRGGGSGSAGATSSSSNQLQRSSSTARAIQMVKEFEASEALARKLAASSSSSSSPPVKMPSDIKLAAGSRQKTSKAVWLWKADMSRTHADPLAWEPFAEGESEIIEHFFRSKHRTIFRLNELYSIDLHVMQQFRTSNPSRRRAIIRDFDAAPAIVLDDQEEGGGDKADNNNNAKGASSSALLAIELADKVLKQDDAAAANGEVPPPPSSSAPTLREHPKREGAGVTARLAKELIALGANAKAFDCPCCMCECEPYAGGMVDGSAPNVPRVGAPYRRPNSVIIDFPKPKEPEAPVSLVSTLKYGELRKIKGVYPGLARIIRQRCAVGTLRDWDDLQRAIGAPSSTIKAIRQNLKSKMPKPPEPSDFRYRWPCQACKKVWCVRCKIEWHEGKTCLDVKLKDKFKKGEDDMMKLVEQGDLFKCKCGKFIEKSEGCKYMKCKCGLYFCWACKKKKTIKNTAALCRAYTPSRSVTDPLAQDSLSGATIQWGGGGAQAAPAIPAAALFNPFAALQNAMHAMHARARANMRPPPPRREWGLGIRGVPPWFRIRREAAKEEENDNNNDDDDIIEGEPF